MKFKRMAETVGQEVNGQIKVIDENGKKACGLYMPDAVFTYKDSGTLITSYVDTGVFVLFEGSDVSDSVDQKYQRYIGENRKTTREIIFQSRNAAAKFVLGEAGRENHWK